MQNMNNIKNTIKFKLHLFSFKMSEENIFIK